jgi:hypothetical protein
MGRPDTPKLKKEATRAARKAAKLRRRADRKRQFEISELARQIETYTVKP